MRHVAGLPAADRTLVMGVINVTPDSFSDGGRSHDAAAAVRHGRQLLDEGADLLDVGGESTRPGAARVEPDEELRRVLPVVEALAELAPVSVDTTRAAVARACLDAGARMVNDVSGGLADPNMLQLVAGSGVAYSAMHWRGHSTDMQDRAVYDDVVADVRRELAARRDAALGAGIPADRLVLDPGLGFAKNAAHNWALLRALPSLAPGWPLLVGASRKAFLGALLDDRPAAGRDAATAAVTVLAAQAGAWAVRVHDVRSSADAVRVVAALAAVPSPGDAAVVAAVEAANTALYEAFERADLDRMQALWDDLDPDAVVCVHPGWPMLAGRGQVLRSWSAVMAGTEYVQFVLTDVRVRLQGDTAVVTCTENILADLSAPNAPVVATNVFVRRPDGWRVQSHHASPVLGRLAES